ncbi:amino acid permease [Nocardioides sp. MAHUQ-72]|uniref:amino acid permease n=1 Tax=unclassified Nocardioides TaxID=2615069 RepID=UPI00362262E6
MSTAPELHKGLKQRHLTMIAIGGVIGAGLFVGSGVVMQTAGPGAFLTYAVTGVLIVMVMRMLGEMATANPSTGSFSDYSRNALGHWAGFSVAWLYWYFWVVVVGFEAVAGAKVVQFWLPDVPLWTVALALMLLMTGTNLFSVGSYGEFEYWFAGIKVAAILVFLVLGGLYVLGVISGDGPHFSNLTAHGGFLPNGVGAIFSSVVVVVFSMVGAEIATVAAAESHDPEKAIARATNSVVLRVGTFYVGSVFLLACMIPWNSDELAASPYVTAFDIIGIPGAEHVMNAVVLTAVLSCLNSGLYTASRMLFVLAAREEAPVSLLTVNAKGVPVRAILFSSVIGFLCVIAAYVSPDTVFAFLLNSSGAIILFVYLLICVSQFVLRRRTPDDQLTVRMWAFPVLTLLTIAGILAILVQMGVDGETRSQLLLSLLAFGVILVAFGLNRLRRGEEAPDRPAPESVDRVLLLANETMSEDALERELRDVHAETGAHIHITVPANPVDTGQAEVEGAVFLWEATRKAARERLDQMIEALRSHGVEVTGALGDHRPLVALREAVADFRPDLVIIATHARGESTWLRKDLVSAARSELSVPVRHVIPSEVDARA